MKNLEGFKILVPFSFGFILPSLSHRERGFLFSLSGTVLLCGVGRGQVK